MKLGILKSYKEIDFLVDSYTKACQECGVESIVLDLFADDWIEKINSAKVDGILVREKNTKKCTMKDYGLSISI